MQGNLWKVGPNAGELMEGGPKSRGTYGSLAQMQGKVIKIPTKYVETISTLCQVVRFHLLFHKMLSESVKSNGKLCRYYFGSIAYSEFSGKFTCLSM